MIHKGVSYRVDILHLRLSNFEGGPEPTGGLTMVALYEQRWPYHKISERFAACGWALCSPTDTFCRKSGREIAINRALLALEKGTPFASTVDCYDALMKSIDTVSWDVFSESYTMKFANKWVDVIVTPEDEEIILGILPW